jgi:GGDEF domain-containing protein
MALTSRDHDLQIDSPWSLGERSALVILVALIPAILVLDHLAEREVSLHLFYVVPVALAAWTLGRGAGHVIAVAAGVSWAFVAIAMQPRGGLAVGVAWDVMSTFVLYLFIAHLVTRHRQFVEALRAQARVDAETGALSRRELDRVLEAETVRSRRYRRPLAIVVFDFAETRGEPRGYLSALVREMRTHVRECDAIGRIDGRRFVLLLVECRPPEPMFVVERLRQGLGATLRVRPQDVAIAVATYGGSLPASAASLLSLAENHIQLARSGPGVAETRVD